MNISQIEFGFNVNPLVPFHEEITVAQVYGFSCMQVWYDTNGFSLLNTTPDAVRSMQECVIPLIIHAVLDINELEGQLDMLFGYLYNLDITEVVVHPVSRGNISRDKAMENLCYWAGQYAQRFGSMGITFYMENNSRLECLFQNIQEMKQVFTEIPQVELLLDIAHIDNYHHLEQILEVKYPRILHVADRHLEKIHEHLTLGEGNIDFQLIFGSYLKNFSGKIIFEVPFDADSRIRSKQIIEQILLSDTRYE